MSLFYLIMVDLLILSLATWRITSLLVNEYGPWHSLEKLRQWIGVYYDENLERTGTNEASKALTCVWCASVWVGALFGVAYLIVPGGTVGVALPWAIMAGALIVNRIVGNG